MRLNKNTEEIQIGKSRFLMVTIRSEKQHYNKKKDSYEKNYLVFLAIFSFK